MHVPEQLSWHVHNQHSCTIATVKLRSLLLSRHYKATLKGSSLYKGHTLKGRHAPVQLSWHACHGQPLLALHTILKGNFERQTLIQRAECEGQMSTWTAVLACSQAASHFSLLSLSSCFSFCCMCPSASHSFATFWNSLTLVTLQPCSGFGFQGLEFRTILPPCCMSPSASHSLAIL